MQLLWLGICEIDLLFNFVEVEQPKPMGRELMTFLCHTSSRALAALEKWLLFVSACIIHSIGRQQHMGTLYHCNSGSPKLWLCRMSGKCLSSWVTRAWICRCCPCIWELFGQQGSSVLCLHPRSFQLHNNFSPPCLCYCARVGFPQWNLSETILKWFLWWGEACLLKTLHSSDKKSLDFSALAKIWEGIQPSFPDRRFMNV